jgi:hypothetical protein
MVLFDAYTVNPVKFARLRLCATDWRLADPTLRVCDRWACAATRWVSARRVGTISASRNVLTDTAIPLSRLLFSEQDE